MRKLVTLLGILALAGCGTTSVTNMKIETEELATNLRIITAWTAPAQAVDSIVISTTFNNVVVNHAKLGTATRDTALFDINLAAPGIPTAGQVFVTTRRRGTSGPSVTQQFNYTRSDVAPPGVGALTILADSL